MNAKPKHEGDLLRLCGLLVDGQLGEGNAQKLAQLLSADAEARAFYRSYMDAHARLLLYHEPVPVVDEPRADRIVVKTHPVQVRRPASSWRWLAPPLAAVCLLLAVGIRQLWTEDPPVAVPDEPRTVTKHGPAPANRSEHPAPPPVVRNVGHWRIVPTGKPDFQVVEPSLVRLNRGELLIESTAQEKPAARGSAQAALHVETPHGDVIATGTRFYVGTHSPPAPRRSATLGPVTRVLVLDGEVTLSTALGSVEGDPGDLLAVEPDRAPVKIAVQATSDFAFDLYQQLARDNEGKNLLFSPYSISSALAMVAEGARHETAAQIGAVLRFPAAARHVGDDAQRIPWETSLIHTGMAELNRKLVNGGDDPAHAAATRARIDQITRQLDSLKQQVSRLRRERKLQELRTAHREENRLAMELSQLAAQADRNEIRVANALWGEETCPFNPRYVTTIDKFYQTGGLLPVDFRNDAEGARLQINRWVQSQTNGRVKDLVPSGGVDHLTRLVLASAICFQGKWSVPFKVQNTKDRAFTLPDGDTTPAATMYAPRLEVARYAAFNADGSPFNTPARIRRGEDPTHFYPEADGFAAVELPYKGNDLSMVVIAPNEPAGLPAIEKRLTPANVRRWIEQLKDRKTHVYLPKFTLDTDYILGDAAAPATLQKMGMVRAFIDPRSAQAGAQLDGMTTSTDPADQLYLSGAFHKAFAEVNETGTEAAAGPAPLGMAPRGSADADYPFIPEFRADRPFLFLIREKSTGSILFLGRMVQPPPRGAAGEDAPRIGSDRALKPGNLRFLPAREMQPDHAQSHSPSDTRSMGKERQ